MVMRPEGTFDEFPDYAPDGSLIAYPRCGGPVCHVMVSRPDGRRVTFAHGFGRITDGQLDHLGIYSARVSGGLRRITVAMQGVGGAADIYTMKTDGTDLRPVTRTVERDSAPDWGGRG
jgi:hypothetical protein